MQKIPLMRPYLGREELDEIAETFDSGWVTQGPKVRRFEELIANYTGARYAVSAANCTAALHLALLAIGVKKGDEVLVADYTYPATGHAVLYCGAKPVFVDVEARTYNIDPSLIEKRITRRTKAIIPVHTFGQPARMNAIMAVARKRGLAVIEDAACALGATFKGRYAGTIGDIGCFSFHARKGITTGEGGMVVTAKKSVAEKVRRLSMFGATVPAAAKGKFAIPKFTEVGYNYKMSDITAAVGIAQLAKIEKIIARKRRLAARWDARLKGIGLVKPPYAAADVRHVYQSYVALVDGRIDRNALIGKLLGQGMQTQIGTYALHLEPVYGAKYSCPNSREIFHRALALPLYYTLKESEIDSMSGILKKTLEDLT